MEIKAYNIHEFLTKVVDGLAQGFHISDNVAHAAQTIGDMHVVTLVKEEAEKVVNEVKEVAVEAEAAVKEEVAKVEDEVQTVVADVKEVAKEL